MIPHRQPYDCISCGPFMICDCNKTKDGSTSAAYVEDMHPDAVYAREFTKQAKQREADKITHPPHYTWLRDKCGVEVWDITQWLPGNLANVVKYVLRAGMKDSAVDDLRKAQQYLEHEIQRLLDQL